MVSVPTGKNRGSRTTGEEVLGSGKRGRCGRVPSVRVGRSYVPLWMYFFLCGVKFSLGTRQGGVKGEGGSGTVGDQDRDT